MRTEMVPGLRSWVVDIGNSCLIVFEGVEPPSSEWIAKMKKFREKVLDPIHKKVVTELNNEMSLFVS